MGQVRFSNEAQEEEEDLYSGYAVTTAAAQPASRRGIGSRLGTAATFRVGTAAADRRGTAAGGMSRRGPGSRAGTSRAAVGFSIPPRTGTASPSHGVYQRVGTGYHRPQTGSAAVHQPNGPANDGTWVPFDFNEQVKTAERVIQRLLEKSIQLASKEDKEGSLEKAKLAVRREKALRKQRQVYHQQMGKKKEEEEGEEEEENEEKKVAPTNLDLTYNTVMNLAARSAENGLWEEAIAALLSIVNNKQFRGNGRLRVNIGELYFQQRDYPNAMKQYRMALDGMDAAEHGQIRKRILRNMALCFCAQEKYNDALHLFQTFNKEGTDHLSALNGLICSFATGETEKMKETFVQLLSTMRGTSAPLNDATLHHDEEAEEEEVMEARRRRETKRQQSQREEEQDKEEEEEEEDTMEEDILMQASLADPLKDYARSRRRTIQRHIILATKLIGPLLQEANAGGFQWILDRVKQGDAAHITQDLEIVRAMQFLQTHEFDQAIAALKALEHGKFRSKIAVLLSALYLLNGNHREARLAADRAIAADRYNTSAYVNRANCLAKANELEGAKIAYQDAITVDADAADALFNLGLLHLSTQTYSNALLQFKKLNVVMKDNAEVLFNLATTCRSLGKSEEGASYLNALLSLNLADASILAQIGAWVAAKDGNAQAFTHFAEAYRYYPADTAVMSWIGAYYMENQSLEQAANLYERLCSVQPTHWPAFVQLGQCYRKMGAYQQAKTILDMVYRKDPSLQLCLDELVIISEHLGHFEAKAKYESEGDKLRKQQKTMVPDKQPDKVTRPVLEETKKEEPLFHQDEGTLDWL